MKLFFWFFCLFFFSVTWKLHELNATMLSWGLSVCLRDLCEG